MVSYLHSKKFKSSSCIQKPMQSGVLQWNEFFILASDCLKLLSWNFLNSSGDKRALISLSCILYIQLYSLAYGHLTIESSQ